MSASTLVMIGFAAVFGLLAVFLSQAWLNNQADLRLKSLDALRKTTPPTSTIVVADKSLRFGELTASSLREVAWPGAALPAGAFAKIADILTGKRIVLGAIDTNEAILKSKITGPGQRATLSAVLGDGMKAVTIRVNDVEGVAGFVLPGDHVDVVLSRNEKSEPLGDVVIQDARVLAIDQLADDRSQTPSVVKAVTLEVGIADGQKVALASTVGTLSLLLRKAGEIVDQKSRRITPLDFGKTWRRKTVVRLYGRTAIAFDIFRFDDGKIVEHWGGQEPEAPPNLSGRTQVDGPTEVLDRDKTEANRTLVRKYRQTVMVSLRFDRIEEFIDGANYAQHASKIGDGIARLRERIASVSKEGGRLYLTPRRFVAEGNFVLVLSEGDLPSGPTALYDLFRVANGKIVEHWDVLTAIPPRDQWRNANGPF